MSQSVPQISIVIPAYNECDNIAILVDEVLAALPAALHCELIVVDDGSTDGTREVLLERLACRPALRLLRHTRNFGQSSALATGLRAARADWVITLDGDGQNDPADIASLLHWLGDPERPSTVRMVCGHRARRRDRWVKRWSSRIANGVRAWALGDGTPDTGCGLKLIHRESFLCVPAFNHMHRFLPALFRRQGFDIVSVVVNHRPRLAGRSKYGVFNRLWVGIVDLIGVAWLQRRRLLPEHQELSIEAEAAASEDASAQNPIR